MELLILVEVVLQVVVLEDIEVLFQVVLEEVLVLKVLFHLVQEPIQSQLEVVVQVEHAVKEMELMVLIVYFMELLQ